MKRFRFHPHVQKVCFFRRVIMRKDTLKEGKMKWKRRIFSETAELEMDRHLSTLKRIRKSSALGLYIAYEGSRGARLDFLA